MRLRTYLSALAAASELTAPEGGIFLDLRRERNEELFVWGGVRRSELEVSEQERRRYHEQYVGAKRFTVVAELVRCSVLAHLYKAMRLWHTVCRQINANGTFSTSCVRLTCTKTAGRSVWI